MAGKGRPTIPVGTECTCSVCGKMHIKQPKRRLCPECLKAEMAMWSRLKYEQRKAIKETTESVNNSSASLDHSLSTRMLRMSLRPTP